MTLGVTFLLDVVTAVLLGLIAVAMLASDRFEHLEPDSVISVALPGHVHGRLGRKPGQRHQPGYPGSRRGHLDFSRTVYLHESVALVVERLTGVAVGANTKCVVMGLGHGPHPSSTPSTCCAMFRTIASSAPWTRRGR